MAQFSVNTARIDPYKNFKFRVRWDGQVVAGVSKVSALKLSNEVVSHREGNGLSTQRHSPGAWKAEAITLERGVTHDPAFEAWASTSFTRDPGDSVSLADLRKDIIIEVMNLQNTVIRAYTVYRCWVSEFTSLPELDANANAIMFETIVLQNEGFERDASIVEVPQF